MTPQLLQRPSEQEQTAEQATDEELAQAPSQPEPAEPTIEIESGQELSLPPNASPSEAAAIAAAMSAHLSAEQAAASAQSSPDYASNWTMARRTGAGRRARTLPRAASGDAWKLAGRLH